MNLRSLRTLAHGLCATCMTILTGGVLMNQRVGGANSACAMDSKVSALFF